MNIYISAGTDEMFVLHGGRWYLKLFLNRIKLDNGSSISIQFLNGAICLD